MTKTNTPPAAKRVIITLEIGEPKKGVRALVISGAPAGEMPLIKTGTFAERHALLDQMWAELLRRPDETPTITEPKPAKAETKKTGDNDKVFGEITDTTETAETEDEAPATETAEAAPAQGDQLVAPEPPADLPVIEGDNTATTGALEAAIIASKESHE